MRSGNCRDRMFTEFMQRTQRRFSRRWFGEGQSAVLVPLKTGETVFGLLCLTFDARRSLPPRSVRLFDAVAEIAGASLRRAVVLEALEKAGCHPHLSPFSHTLITECHHASEPMSFL